MRSHPRPHSIAEPSIAPRASAQTVFPQSLADRVAKTLREDILGGTYAPGAQLPSGKELGIQFGVSVTVVRESLSRLKADGLIASRQGKGVFVCSDATARPFRLTTPKGDYRALLDVFELRMGVEVQAAGLAAERRTTRNLNIMAKCLKLMKPSPKSFDAALAADIAFHNAIAEATRNQLIFRFMEFLQPHLKESIALARANSARSLETETAAYQEHYEIYEAIRAGDRSRACEAVRCILESTLRRLERAQTNAGTTQSL